MTAVDVRLPGDRARRRTLLSLLVLALSLPLSYLLFSRAEALWLAIEPLEGIVFLLAATGFGLVLASAPIIAFVSFLLTVWFGVDSIFLPRRQPRKTVADYLLLAFTLLVWLSPMLFCLATALQALVSGEVHFSRPQRDYLRATDPIAFWQGVGFWLIMATLFGFLAWRYWAPRLCAGKAGHPGRPERP